VKTRVAIETEAVCVRGRKRVPQASLPSRREYAMPRYHFHVTNARETLENPKGMDLPGNAAAREEAVVLAKELRHGQVMPGRNWQGWFVTVVDQHGHQVDSVPIADMPDE
jgi:hypothetical protein